MAVNERTFEIGVLAALGWSPRRILRLILIEGVIMSAAGGVIGIILGALTMEMAAKTKFAAGLIVPYLSGWSIAQALIFVFIAGPLARSTGPWRATRLLPADRAPQDLTPCPSGTAVRCQWRQQKRPICLAEVWPCSPDSVPFRQDVKSARHAETQAEGDRTHARGSKGSLQVCCYRMAAYGGRGWGLGQRPSSWPSSSAIS